MHKQIAFLIAAIALAAMVIPTYQIALAADKTINCDNGSKINFKGKNDVDIVIPAGGTGTQGEKGDKGDKGDTGDPGAPGQDGTDGTDGQDCKDAELSEDQTTALNFLTENQDSLSTVIEMLNNGTLGASIDEVPDNGNNETQPPVDNGTNTETNSTEDN